MNGRKFRGLHFLFPCPTVATNASFYTEGKMRFVATGIWLERK